MGCDGSSSSFFPRTRTFPRQTPVETGIPLNTLSPEFEESGIERLLTTIPSFENEILGFCGQNLAKTRLSFATEGYPVGEPSLLAHWLPVS
jgi:hypothetical protein